MRLLWVGWGDLGAAATPALVQAGHEVVALRRSPIDNPPAGVIPLLGDLNAPEGLQVPGGVEACIVTLTPDTRDQVGYEHAYLHGLANLHVLLQGEIQLSNPPLERLIFVSSTAVYGQFRGERVTEAASTSPSRFNGRVMVRAERLAASAKWPTTITRLSGIYGPGRTRLLDKVREGRSSRNAWTNRIHRDDAAAALVHVVGLETAPDVVNVTDTEPATNDTVLSWLADQLDIPIPPIDDGPVGGKRVDGSRLASTGFTHRYPTFREGYADLLAGT